MVDVLVELGRLPGRERVVLLGAGGAARSLADALRTEGAVVSAWARDPARVLESWRALEGIELHAWDGAEARRALAAATLVVNSTPLSSSHEPIPLDAIPRNALLVDLNYGPRLSEMASAARAVGRDAYDGLGLLVHQARRAMAVWTGTPPPVAALARAVGWPR